MRAIWIKKFGGPEVLEVREGPEPTPGAGEVRVGVRACGLNFAEVMARQGMYPDAPKPPCILGYEGAGVIDAVGAGVTGLSVGDRVVYMSRFGGHASSIVVSADRLLPMAEGMTFEEGAALPVNYLTAYHMLFAVRRIKSGDRVLIHMAAGGVGTAVLQLCRTVPGVVTIGTASAKKHDYVRGHGADHVIDYRSVDYVAEVQRITGGRGVDVVLDALGGPDWTKGYSILAPGGLLVAFGFANANVGGKRNLLHALGQLLRSPRFGGMKLMNDNRGFAGVNMGHLWDTPEVVRSEADALVPLYRDGRIRPHIGGSFPFSRAAEAYGELEYGRNVGKIVLTPD
jgi:NADPH:quinone reductase-like Zn-dependent oxidoreductase